MTYKHMKFEDSATMRSLERLALKKGMIKNEPMQKKAEDKVISESFSENLLRLCQKLREKGFSKYAKELEIKFLIFKQAECNLYDVTKETGEDLVDFAHPEGSKKLDKDWDELGTVETVIDQHNKILDIVKKMPKGKLANKNAINAVKIIMAQLAGGANEEEQFADLASKELSKALLVWNTIDNIVNQEGGLINLGPLAGWSRGRTYKIQSAKIVKLLTAHPVTVDNINAAKNEINSVYETISPGITGGVSENTWNVVSSMFHKMNEPINRALQYQNKSNALRTTRLLGESEETKPASPQSALPKQTVTLPEVDHDFGIRVDEQIKYLGGLKAQVEVQNFTPQEKTAALSWIGSQTAEFLKIKNVLDKLTPDQKANFSKRMESKFSTLVSEINEFEKEWLQ